MAKIESLVPVSGMGFVTNNRTPNSHYATSYVHARLIDVAGLWFAKHPHNPVSIGQISRKGGGSMPPHKQHRLGIEVDIRPFRTDGKNLSMDYHNPQYSQELTREFVQLLRANAVMHRIFFNDPVLIREGLTSRAKGHDNHLHLWFEV